MAPTARRALAAFVAASTLLAACSIDESAMDMTPVGAAGGIADAPASVPPESDARDIVLPAVGPAPGTSHWHAAYVVRVCDEVLAPFETDNDPLGIHTHGDGLIHVHPFFEESGFERATLGLFADAMGFDLADGELTLPGGGTWRDGDLCDGEPARVYVDRWVGPGPDSEVTRVFEGVGEIRFTADRELYQIAFAPVDAPPVVPPNWEQLDQVSAPLVDEVDPWVRIDDQADPNTVRVYPVDDVSAAPCGPGQVEESVLSDDAACFTPGAPVLDRTEAITAARAVEFNRSPAVELTITPTLRSLIRGRFETANPDESAFNTGGFAIAIELGGAVVSAPLIIQPSPSESRLIVAGGLSTESAIRLAEILGG